MRCRFAWALLAWALSHVVSALGDDLRLAAVARRLGEDDDDEVRLSYSYSYCFYDCGTCEGALESHDGSGDDCLDDCEEVYIEFVAQYCCNTDAYSFSFDYSGYSMCANSGGGDDCPATCQGLTCDYLIAVGGNGISCDALEMGGCDCSGCDCPAPPELDDNDIVVDDGGGGGTCTADCSGFTCDELSDYDCATLEAYGCDCTGCACVTGDDDDGACAADCSGYTCDDLNDYDYSQYACATLETTYGCDCTGCACVVHDDDGDDGGSGACAATSACSGYTCDELSSQYSCATLETYGCDCTGCACVAGDDDDGGYGYGYGYGGGGDCPASCNGETCDYYGTLGILSVSCDTLEAGGCDCSGCNCGDDDNNAYGYGYNDGNNDAYGYYDGDNDVYGYGYGGEPSPRPTITAAPTPTPLPAEFAVTSGDCVLHSNCVRSPNYPLDYDPSTTCTIVPLNAGLLIVTAFDIELAVGCSYDALDVDGARYCGHSGPDGVAVTTSTTISFSSDGSVGGNGFEICLDTAPSPSPTLTIAPTQFAEFFVTDGECAANGACVSSPNYPLVYDPSTTCIIVPREAGMLSVTAFDLEDDADCYYDALYVDGALYCGDSGPDGVGVTTSTTISFSSDGSVGGSGFQICLAAAGPAPSPRPTITAAPTQVAEFFVTDGDCAANGACVSSPNYPLDYDSSATCTIVPREAGMLSVTAFDLEANDYCIYDALDVDGSLYCGDSGPDGVGVTTSTTISFSSDSSVGGSGFQICLDTAVGSPTPGPIAPPLPVPSPTALPFPLPSVNPTLAPTKREDPSPTPANPTPAPMPSATVSVRMAIVLVDYTCDDFDDADEAGFAAAVAEAVNPPIVSTAKNVKCDKRAARFRSRRRLLSGAAELGFDLEIDLAASGYDVNSAPAAELETTVANDARAELKSAVNDGTVQSKISDHATDGSTLRSSHVDKLATAAAIDERAEPEPSNDDDANGASAAGATPLLIGLAVAGVVAVAAAVTGGVVVYRRRKNRAASFRTSAGFNQFTTTAVPIGSQQDPDFGLQIPTKSKARSYAVLNDDLIL